MVKPSEQIANKVKIEISKTIELIGKKEDIRLILSRVGQVSMSARVNAEMVDDPDTRFTSFLVSSLYSLLTQYYRKNSEEWYELNRRLIEDLLPPLKVFLESFGKSFVAGDSDGIVDACKTFFYAAWKHIDILAS